MPNCGEIIAEHAACADIGDERAEGSVDLNEPALDNEFEARDLHPPPAWGPANVIERAGEDAAMIIHAQMQMRVDKAQAYGRTVTLKIKLGDFRILTRSRTLPAPPVNAEDLWAIGAELLRAQLPLPMGARLLGLGLSNLVDGAEEEDEEEAVQLRLAFG